MTLPNLKNLLARTTPGPDAATVGYSGYDEDLYKLEMHARLLAQALIDAGEANKRATHILENIADPYNRDERRIAWAEEAIAVLAPVLARLADIDKDIGVGEGKT
jgi:hypothetical protein